MLCPQLFWQCVLVQSQANALFTQCIIHFKWGNVQQSTKVHNFKAQPFPACISYEVLDSSKLKDSDRPGQKIQNNYIWQKILTAMHK